VAEDLVVGIGADASDFIAETGKASKAFDRFTDDVEKDAKRSSAAFGKITGSSKTLSENLNRSFSEVQKNFKKGGIGKGFTSLNSEVTKLTSGFGSLRGAAASTGISAINGAATVALGGVTALATATAALSTGLIAIGTNGAVAFSKFEDAFAQVQTLLPPAFSDVQKLEEGVRNLTKQFGTDLIGATNAAYQAISQGVAPAQTVKFLETAFTAAGAGASTTTEAVNLLAATLNAFNLPMSKASEVSDIFFTTIAKGATTAQELSASIGQVAPVANAAGIQFDEVASSLAALTLGGVNTAEAATQLKSVIAGIVAPSKEAGDALNAIGVNARLLREEGLDEAFKRLQEATGGSLEELTKFLPNIRAAQGGAALAGGQFENFNKILEANRKSLGATSDAAGKTQGTLGKSFGRLSATVNDAFVSIGKIVGTALGPSLDVVTKFVDEIQSELELVATALQGPAAEATAFFDSFKSGSDDASTVVGAALRSVGDALATVSAFIADNSNAIATFGALYRQQFAIAETGVGVLALGVAALSKVLAGLLGIGSAVASLFSDDVAAGLSEANDLAHSFGDTVGEFAFDRIVSGAEAAANLGETFDSVKGAAEGASASLAVAAGGVSRLGSTVDDLAAKQRAAAEAQDKVAESSSGAAKAAGNQAAATEEVAAANEGAAVSARDLFEQVDQGKISAQEATKALNGMSTAARDSAGAQRELATALQIFNEATRVEDQARLGERIESLGSAAQSVSGKIAQAFGIINVVLKDRFRAAGEEAVETFARVRQGSDKFLNEIKRLESIQVSFLDATVFDTFISASGTTSSIIKNFSDTTLDAFRVVSNVLTGDLRKAGDALVDTFARGRISSAQFKDEVSKLAQAELGFSELFRGVDELASGFDTLANRARNAEGALGTEIRAAVLVARAELDAGKITLDQYAEALRTAGENARDFGSLSREQLVVFEKVRSENEGLAQTILDLSKNLDSSLKPAFDDYLKAASQSGLKTEELEKVLSDLSKQNDKVKTSTTGLAGAQRDGAKAAGEITTAQDEYQDSVGKLGAAILLANQQQQLQFDLLAIGTENFFDAATGVKLLNQGNSNLLNSTNKLGEVLDDVGQQKLQRLVGALGDGVLSSEQFRSEVKKLASEFGVLADEAEKANSRIQKAFSGSNGISAFGKPGGIGFDSFGQADAGASVFGSRRVTGSSNFQSAQEAQLGAQLGLGPKALRERLARQGFVDGGSFQSGGALLSTGRADVEAGEFILSQRGLSDLGKTFGDLLNRGRGDTVVNQTNTFAIKSQSPEGDGKDMLNELAFKLRPALFRAGGLAASRSPIT